MQTLRPKIAILTGAAIGLVAGAAVYGAVSTSAPAKPTSTLKVASVSVAPPAKAPALVRAPARPHCKKGAKLEKGVCVVHVEKVVNVERVVRVQPAAQRLAQPVAQAGRAEDNSGQSSPDDSTRPPAVQARDHEGAEHANEGAEHESEAAEHEREDGEHANEGAEQPSEDGEHAKDAAEHASDAAKNASEAASDQETD